MSMKTRLSLIASCATIGLLSSHAWAQDTSINTNSSSGQQNTSLQQANALEFYRASTVIGKNTQDSKGTKVGEIQDIAFNQQGQLFAFVDVGGGKWAVVPWQALKPETAKGKGNVTLKATAQQLKAGPAVTKDQWGSVNNPQFIQGCYAYYNLPAPTATGGASSPGGVGQGQGPDSGTNRSSTAPSH